MSSSQSPRWFSLGASRPELGFAGLRCGQFSVDAANRLRRAQLRGTIEQNRVMLFCNTFFVPMLSFQAWDSGINEIVIGWTMFMLLFSWWLLFSWRRMYATNGEARDVRYFVNQTIVNALGWAVGFALFYPVVQGDQKIIVTTVMAGTLAIGTVGFAKMPPAAFVYVLILTIGNCAVTLVSGLRTGSSTDYLMSFLSLTAGASVGNAALERAKAAITSFRNLEKLSEKTEVIDLLLKDYEAQTSEWLWQTDECDRIINAPPPVLEMLGVSQQTQHGGALVDAIAAQSNSASDGDLARLRLAVEDRQEFHDIQLSITDATNGKVRWIEMKGRPQFDSGSFLGFRGIFADATATVEAKRQVEFLAKHDGLTSLLNRTSIVQRLEELEEHDLFASGFLIDLDGFKQVNDSYGHMTGDLLLQIVSTRLSELSNLDVHVARLGGDEFFILRTSLERPRPEALAGFARHLVARLSKPYQVSEFSLHLSASVGIACLGEPAQDGKDLLRKADLALYEAKKNGRNRFEFYEIGLQEALDQRIAITERLKVAIRECKIISHYQPQHDLTTGQLIGFEALARWEDDDLGDIRPDVFIPLAEQTGLIDELGKHLLHQCCCDAVTWSKLPGQETPLLLSVNLSPLQFARLDVADLVGLAIQESGLSPSQLEVEVTEGVLIADKDITAAKLREISQLGISIALDDFGTGYSSLSYLKDLPLNRLKIDKSFVFDITTPSTRKIVETVIHLGHSLGLSVIAEGIEDQHQVATLARLGCEDGQGYLFGRPMPFDQTLAYIADQKTVSAVRA